MRKLISAVTLCAMAVSMMVGLTVTASAATNGNGTADDPYIVSTAEEWTGATKQGYIKLGGNIEVASGYRTAGDFTLDLNGYTLTSTGKTTIEVYGGHSFTLVDTGATRGALVNAAVTGTTYTIQQSASNSNIIIDGATVRSKNAQCILTGGSNSSLTGINLNIRGDSYIEGAAYAINASNGTNVVIDNVTVNSEADSKGYALWAQGNSKVTINDGTFNYKGTVSSVVLTGSSTVTINGGTFYNPNPKRGALNNAKGYTGVLTINGGVFENTYDGVGYSIYDNDENTTEIKPQILINGGEFRDVIGYSKQAYTTTVIKVAGGIFAFDPTSYVDTSAYDVTKADGTWTVSKKQAEAGPVVTPVDAGVTNAGDGYKSAVYKVNAKAHGTKRRLAVTVEGSNEGTQYKDISTDITDSDVIFAVVLIGSENTAFPTNITAEFVD